MDTSAERIALAGLSKTISSGVIVVKPIKGAKMEK